VPGEEKWERAKHFGNSLMAKEQTTGQITSRELNRLIDQIEDKGLREQLLKAVSRLDVDKKYGLRFERHIPEIVSEGGKTISLGGIYFPWLRLMGKEENGDFGPVQGKKPKGPEHILVEADNYIALKYMQYTHAGQIDVIYIDPPYNTGAKDWKYNNDYVDSEDQFRHSKWLSFMEKRLRLAKRLLKPDGVLICAIDHYELFPLGMLLEEIFRGWEVTQTVVVNNPRGRAIDPFAICHEYHLVIHSPGKKSKGAQRRNIKKDFPKTDNIGRYREIPLRRSNEISGNREQRPNQFYPIWVDNETLEVKEVGVSLKEGENPKEKKGQTSVLPINTSGKEKVWSYSAESLRERIRTGRIELVVKRTTNGIQIAYKGRETETTRPKTVWIGEEHDYSTQGSKLIESLIPKNGFSFPKSIETVKFAIDRFLPKNGICLDFFAGSGTTFQAVAELNEADGGTRQCILVTNNESNICRDVTWERMKRVTTGTHDYPECTKKYNGCPSAQVAFYKMEVYDQNYIQGKLRGWKQRMEGYLPLLSFKEKLSHDWERIPGTKGFFQKNIAVVDGTETDYDTVGFLKDKRINTLWIVCDDREEFRMIKSRLPSTIRHCHQLPRGYRDHFEAFYRDEE